MNSHKEPQIKKKKTQLCNKEIDLVEPIFFCLKWAKEYRPHKISISLLHTRLKRYIVTPPPPPPSDKVLGVVKYWVLSETHEVHGNISGSMLVWVIPVTH